MSNVVYNRRIWLNSVDSHYTGSITCCDAMNIVNRGKFMERYSFIEIADCHGKIRLHTDDNFPLTEFIAKLRILEWELREFREHLEGTI